MGKTIIVINGKGGVGKDTLCKFADKNHEVMVRSAITPVASVAGHCGWNGQKDLKSRKLLSDLKKVMTEYNDAPNNYLVMCYESFMASKYDILFVHIREKEEIVKFRNSIREGAKCITLLIRSNRLSSEYGNTSDDNVEDFNYDYIYNNDLPLDKAEDDFCRFLEMMLGEK